MRQTQRHEMSKKKSSPKGKRKLEFIEKKKTKTPLTGKTIFLDIKEARIKQRIETDLLKLGATVEGFLSKDINYLITATPPAKHTKHDGKFGSPESPAISTPSPFNMGPSPSPSNPENIKKPVPTVSRGKAIYDKAKIAKKNNIVVENAQKWGVKIVGLEVAQKWIQKEVAKLPNDSKKGSQEKKGCSLSSNGGAFKVKKLKSPFVKFEDISNQYRVVYQHLTAWPHVNVDTPKGTCPFDGTRVGRDDESIVDRRDKIGLQNFEQHSDDELASGDSPNVDGKIKKSDSAGIIGPVRIVTAGEIRRRAERKRLQEKKRGYCECCQIKYENLDKHIREEQHKTFVKDKSNYESLDHLIKTATNCNTAKFLQRTLTNHLQKGRQSSEDVDVSIPEAKQWTPRKSTATNLMMKNQRKKKFKMDKEDAKQNKSFDKNKHEEDSDLESTKIKSPNKTKESVVYDGEIEHASKVTNHTNCDGSDVKVDERITAVYFSPIRARRSRNGTGSSKKDTTVVDRLNNMTIDSPMQTNATVLNTSGMETNQNVQMDSSLNKSTNEDSEINKVRKNKNRNDGSDKKTVKEENMKNSYSTIKLCSDHDKNHERKNSIQKIERNNTELSQQTVEKKITLNQNEGFPDPHHRKSGEVRENIFDTFSSITATCINKDTVEKNKMDIENHYVPKIAKEFVAQQNMSQNRVDWGDNDSGISNYVAKDEKTVKKRWSQKLMSKQHQQVNEDIEVQKNIVDEVDGMIVDPSSQESLKICTVKNIAEKSNKNTSERVLKKLTRKFCDEKTIYLNMNDKELSDISPVVKGREHPPKSPVFGRSPSTKYQRKLQVPKAEDVYDFDDSPQKTGDVYDFGSEISLIYPDSPNLSRKKKTHSKELENVAVKKKLNLSSPKSGMSNSPRSAKRKKWRKKMSTPNSDSKMKKLDKLKVQVASCDMETSTNVDSSSELHVDNKNCEILTKEASANKSLQSVNKEKYSVHKNKSSSVQKVDKDNVHKNKSSSVQRLDKDKDNVRKNKSSSVQSVNKAIDSVPKKKSSSIQSVNKDLDNVHKKKSSSVQSVNKDLDNVHKKKSSSVQSVNKDLDNVHKKKSSSVQSVNKDLDSVHKKKSSSVQSVNKNVDCVHKKRSSVNSRSCKSNVSPSSSCTCVNLSTNDCSENIQRRTNKSTGTEETIEMSAFTSHLPKSLHVIDNSKFCISSPMCHTGNGDAIKRLSPSKSFDLKSIDNVDIEMNSPEKNPQKSSQKNKQFDDSGQGSGKKEKSLRNKLVWMSAEINKKKSKTCKLNTSISLLSDRSFGKLLTSDDGNELFEGFSKEDISAENTLGSDASFVETTEIDLDENSHQEWVMDAEMIMNEDSKFDTLIPEFTSPGKRSDSSWGEACEDFIQSQLSFNTSLSKSNMTSPSSPRRVPLYFGSMMSPGKRKRLSSIEEENTVLLTPKRKNKRMKLIKNGIEKVDDDIEFNHLSPQKVKSFRSPSKNNRETICSSSPLNDLRQKTLTSVSNTDSNLSGKVNKKSSTKNKQKKYSEKPQKSEDKNKSKRKSKADKKKIRVTKGRRR